MEFFYLLIRMDMISSFFCESRKIHYLRLFGHLLLDLLDPFIVLFTRLVSKIECI